MAEVTVSQFAEVLKVPVDKLITQLDEAGIKVSGADDIISDEAKMELLTHLRRAQPVLVAHAWLTVGPVTFEIPIIPVTHGRPKKLLG